MQQTCVCVQCVLSASAGCCEGGSGKLRTPDMDVVTYDGVHVTFTQGEWACWILFTSLYKGVRLEAHRNLIAIGYIWEDHIIEEHVQSPRRHGK